MRMGVFLAALALAAASRPALADEVRLKNGDRLSGSVVHLADGKLRFRTAYGPLGVYVAVNQLEGHRIMPFVHRWTVALPPALGIFAVVGMGYLLGPLGLLLATPLTVVVFVLVKKLYLRDTLGEQVDVKRPVRG